MLDLAPGDRQLSPDGSCAPAALITGLPGTTGRRCPGEPPGTGRSVSSGRPRWRSRIAGRWRFGHRSRIGGRWRWAPARHRRSAPDHLVALRRLMRRPAADDAGRWRWMPGGGAWAPRPARCRARLVSAPRHDYYAIATRRRPLT
ncbi:hypothetical protein HBB16_08650 [Pseudonocardia sp. MCCB 268]|nr:hypothetical protein [Pseudonocardia cytotoxica]